MATIDQSLLPLQNSPCQWHVATMHSYSMVNKTATTASTLMQNPHFLQKPQEGVRESVTPHLYSTANISIGLATRIKALAKALVLRIKNIYNSCISQVCKRVLSLYCFLYIPSGLKMQYPSVHRL